MKTQAQQFKAKYENVIDALNALEGTSVELLQSWKCETDVWMFEDNSALIFNGADLIPKVLSNDASLGETEMNILEDMT